MWPQVSRSTSAPRRQLCHKRATMLASRRQRNLSRRLWLATGLEALQSRCCNRRCMTSTETGVTLRARWPAACCRRSMTSTWSRTVWLSFGLPVLANSSQAFARPLRGNHMLRLQTDRHRVEAANAPPEHPLRSVTSVTPYVGQDQLWGRPGPALGGMHANWLPDGPWSGARTAQVDHSRAYCCSECGGNTESDKCQRRDWPRRLRCGPLTP